MTAVFSIVAVSTAAAQAQTFDISSGEAAEALNEFAQQAGVSVVYRADKVAGFETNAVDGAYEPGEALELMLADTGLSLIQGRSDAFAVRAVSDEEGSSDSGNAQPASSPVMAAQAPTSAQQTQSPPSRNEISSRSADDRLEEIVVIGSNIRGAQNASSPVLTFDREAIEQSGLATVEQFIQSLPQNFGGDVSEATIGGVLGGSATGGVTSATGVNLRGLGAEATLTLFNGRRLAPQGIGEGVDLSLIPLTAIERIEVLTDGGSAIYGSDAMAGVVNFVTQKNFDGAETGLRYGSVTEGNHEEIEFQQALGKNWSSGNVLAAYRYRKRSNLDSQDRSFTKDAFDPQDLLPENEQHALVVSLQQEIADRHALYVDSLYSTRDTDQASSFPGNVDDIDIASDQLNVTVGGLVALSPSWEADLSIQYGLNEGERVGVRNGMPTGATGFQSENEVALVEAKADGTAFTMTGGDAKLAFGAQYRDESFNSTGTTVPTSGTIDRDVVSLFAEFLFPLVGEGNRRPMLEGFEFSIAARWEDYSDFGTTTNPKFGVSWKPTAGTNIRGTWGTSFRAPLLFELSDAQPPSPLAWLLADPQSPAGVSAGILVFGNNPELQPEEATTWTVGVDWEPPFAEGLNLALTYFNIEVDDRIATPLATRFPESLSNPAFAGLVDRMPNPDEIAFWASRPNFIDFFGIPGGQFSIIVDARLANVSSTRQDGLDFNIDYSRAFENGVLGIDLSASYLFDIDDKITPDAPEESILNTAFNPVDLNLRGSVFWAGKVFTTSLFVDYIDDYEDVRVGLEGDIDSWTTVNLSILYDAPDDGPAFFAGTRLALSVTNLLDEDPPFVVNTSRSLNFDATNATAIGRFVALQLTKTW